MGVLGTVVIAAVLAFMVTSSTHKKTLAMQADALQYYDLSSPVPGSRAMTPEERLKKAEGLFSELAENKSSPYSGMALFYKANSEMEMGNMDAAIDGYKILIGKTPVDPVLVSLANNRLGAAYLAKGSMDGPLPHAEERRRPGRLSEGRSIL